MTYVVFENPSEVDVTAVTTFGVSVKQGDNPIGMFGTGFKYAVGILLREGHEVRILSGRDEYMFGTQSDLVRGQEFSFVTMSWNGGDPMRLGFTTDVGRNWETWMAYRELRSNAQDEGGGVRLAGHLPEAREDWTYVAVRGMGIERVHQDRARYFLEGAPLATTRYGNIHRDGGHGVFYQGILVSSIAQRGIHTYDLRTKLALTEERQAKSEYDVQRKVAEILRSCEDEDAIRCAVTAPSGTFEHTLNFQAAWCPLSDVFVRTIGRLVEQRMARINSSAVKAWEEETESVAEPEVTELTTVEREMLRRARLFCAGIGEEIRHEVRVVESLGEGVYGLARNNTIYVTRRALGEGTKQVAATLLEEHLHLTKGVRDETREMQELLFRKIMSLGEEIRGEPL